MPDHDQRCLTDHLGGGMGTAASPVITLKGEARRARGSRPQAALLPEVGEAVGCSPDAAWPS